MNKTETPPLTAYRIYLEDGSDYVTSMAPGISLEEARAYFVGQALTQEDEVTKLHVLRVEQADVTKLSDEDLKRLWREAEEDIDGLSDAVAEDRSEAAAFGDGPCGSQRRYNAYAKAQRAAQAYAAEYRRRNAPEEPEPAAGDDEIPF